MTVDLAGEGFTATGLMVTERNFLDIYRYQSWGGQDQLPLFTQGQTFTPAAVELKQVGEAAAVQPPLGCSRGGQRLGGWAQRGRSILKLCYCWQNAECCL